MVLRLHQRNIGYTGDGFYMSKDPTNSIKVLMEATKDKSKNGNNTNTHAETIMYTQNDIHT